jgi:hypothetical protein
VRRLPEDSSRSPYFVNAWLDAAAIGGLSIAVFAGLRLLFNRPATPVVFQAAAVLSVFVNYPHFSATVYRLYQRTDNVKQFPITSLVLPLLLAGAVTACLWQPETIAPYFVTLVLVWSAYHYSGQTIGITLLYARRNGFQIGRRERLAVSAFVYATFIGTFADPFNNNVTTQFGVTIPVMHFPSWFYASLVAAMGAGAGVFLYSVVAHCRSRRCMPPLMMLLPAVTQFVWFMPGRHTAMFFPFIPLFHSLQYLYIAWAMQMGLRLGGAAGVRTGRTVTRESLRWALSNYVGGILLFIALPWLPFWVNLPTATVAGVMLAAVNMHHFFVDGVIWKLRDTAVTSPLMMNIADWDYPQAVLARPDVRRAPELALT